MKVAQIVFLTFFISFFVILPTSIVMYSSQASLDKDSDCLSSSDILYYPAIWGCVIFGSICGFIYFLIEILPHKKPKDDIIYRKSSQTNENVSQTNENLSQTNENVLKPKGISLVFLESARIFVLLSVVISVIVIVAFFIMMAF